MSSAVSIRRNSMRPLRGGKTVKNGLKVND
jgi:hypothetical protein